MQTIDENSWVAFICLVALELPFVIKHTPNNDNNYYNYGACYYYHSFCFICNRISLLLNRETDHCQWYYKYVEWPSDQKHRVLHSYQLAFLKTLLDYVITMQCS